jgi:hypothetical protein
MLPPVHLQLASKKDSRDPGHQNSAEFVEGGELIGVLCRVRAQKVRRGGKETVQLKTYRSDHGTRLPGEPMTNLRRRGRADNRRARGLFNPCRNTPPATRSLHPQPAHDRRRERVVGA